MVLLAFRVDGALFDKFAKLIMGAVDDTAKVFLLSLRSVLVKGRRRM